MLGEFVSLYLFVYRGINDLAASSTVLSGARVLSIRRCARTQLASVAKDAGSHQSTRACRRPFTIFTPNVLYKSIIGTPDMCQYQYCLVFTKQCA